MPQVNSIPSQKEYEKVLLDLQSKYNKTVQEMEVKGREMDKSNYEVRLSSGGRGCRGGGGMANEGCRRTLAWIDKSASDWNNIYKPSYEGSLQSIKKEISDYQKDVMGKATSEIRKFLTTEGQGGMKTVDFERADFIAAGQRVQDRYATEKGAEFTAFVQAIRDAAN